MFNPFAALTVTFLHWGRKDDESSYIKIDKESTNPPQLESPVVVKDSRLFCCFCKSCNYQKQHKYVILSNQLVYNGDEKAKQMCWMTDG